MDISRIPEQLADHIKEETEKAGYDLVDMIAKGGNRGFFLEIILDKEGGITLDECGNFNRHIAYWIDENDVLKTGYTIDVSSPGLDRELKSDTALLWATGRQVEVRVYEPVCGKNVLIGKLVEGSGEDTLTLEDENGETVVIDKGNISRTKLWVEL